jgi:hypothetical protein
MRAFGRSVLAVGLGVVAGCLIISAIEMLSPLVTTWPADLHGKDPEAMQAAMAKVPVGALFLVLLAWVLGTFGGSWVAARVAESSRLLHGLIVGACFLLAGIVIMLMISHPWWVWLLAFVVFPLSAYCGAKLVPDRSRPEQPPLIGA